MPTRGRHVAMAVPLNRYALEDDVHPDREGNGHLYLLAKPLSHYVALPPMAPFPRASRAQPDRRREQRAVVVNALALLVAASVVVAVGPHIVR
jgi:hypothetical protein